MLEFVRDGLTLEQVTENGKKMLGKDLVQIGIDKMVTQIIIEANFKNSGQKTIMLENPICNQESDLNLLFHGSFLPIPNKDVFKSNQKSDEYVMIDMEQKIIENEADATFPGKIIPYECTKSESSKQESQSLDTNQSNNNNNNEEGELKDEDENSQEKNEDMKMQTSDSNDQKIPKLTENIYLNKNKNPNDCILLTVHNLSKQTIKVKKFNLKTKIFYKTKKI